MNRTHLAATTEPDRQVLRRLPTGCRAGRLQVITPGMARQYATHTASAALTGRGGVGIEMGPREAAGRGLEIGFYRDNRGFVRHVQNERDDIEADRAALQAADNGLMSIGDSQRLFMERRSDLLREFDARQARRFSQPGPGY